MMANVLSSDISAYILVSELSFSGILLILAYFQSLSKGADIEMKHRNKQEQILKQIKFALENASNQPIIQQILDSYEVDCPEALAEYARSTNQISIANSIESRTPVLNLSTQLNPLLYQVYMPQPPQERIRLEKKTKIVHKIQVFEQQLDDRIQFKPSQVTKPNR